MSEEQSGFEDVFADLSKAFLNAGGKYGAMERYADFRQLFMGSEQGRRVLYQILGWGHVFRNAAGAARFEPNQTMFLQGENNLALKIFATVHSEPKPQPQQANSKQPPPKKGTPA